MTIDQLIQIAKQTPVSQEQVESLRERLAQESEDNTTIEFLNRTYTL